MLASLTKCLVMAPYSGVFFLEVGAGGDLLLGGQKRSTVPILICFFRVLRPSCFPTGGFLHSLLLKQKQSRRRTSDRRE